MNRKYLLLAVLLMVGLNAKSQLYKKPVPQLKLGLEGGPSLVRLIGNQYLEANYKSILHQAAGLSLQILVPKSSFSFKCNIFYERKGAKSEDLFLTNSNGTVIGITNNEILLSYVTIPVMLRLRTKGRVGLFADVGAFAGYLLKQEDITGAKDTIPEKIVNSTEAANKLDGGFVIGAGFEIPIQRKFTVSFEVRDNIGVYDINNAARTKGGIVKTNAINFLVGVGYRLERKYMRRK